MNQNRAQVQLLRRRIKNTLVLQPYQLGHIEQTATQAVKKLLFTFYDEDFQGIIIQVNKIVVENDLIKTFDDSHNMFMNIEYSITIMTLPIGTFLQGKLVQQFQSHVILQIFELFNISIEAENINTKSLKWSEEFQSYIEQHQNQIVEFGELLQFQIQSFNAIDSTHFDIKGSLKTRKNTGLVKYLQQNLIAELPDKIQEIITKSQQQLTMD